MFFFIFCSFGANTTTSYFKLTPYSTLPSYIYSTPYIKLATTPPPLHTPSTALAIKRAPCGAIPRATDGDAAWRGEIPAKTPARTAAVAHYRPAFPNAHVSHGAVKRHLPPLPGSEARKGRGGRAASPCDWWRDRTRPKEGGGKSAQRELRQWRTKKRVKRSAEQTCLESARAAEGQSKKKRSGAELSRRAEGR